MRLRMPQPMRGGDNASGKRLPGGGLAFLLKHDGGSVWTATPGTGLNPDAQFGQSPMLCLGRHPKPLATNTAIHPDGARQPDTRIRVLGIELCNDPDRRSDDTHLAKPR